jgi:hypothetical protein
MSTTLSPAVIRSGRRIIARTVEPSTNSIEQQFVGHLVELADDRGPTGFDRKQTRELVADREEPIVRRGGGGAEQDGTSDYRVILLPGHGGAVQKHALHEKPSLVTEIRQSVC